MSSLDCCDHLFAREVDAEIEISCEEGMLSGEDCEGKRERTAEEGQLVVGDLSSIPSVHVGLASRVGRSREAGFRLEDLDDIASTLEGMLLPTNEVAVEQADRGIVDHEADVYGSLRSRVSGVGETLRKRRTLLPYSFLNPVLTTLTARSRMRTLIDRFANKHE